MQTQPSHFRCFGELDNRLPSRPPHHIRELIWQEKLVAQRVTARLTPGYRPR